MKKILLAIIIVFLTGCSANYELEYKDNKFNESLTTFSNINDEAYKEEVDNFYDNGYLLTDYLVQTGDMPFNDIINSYSIYNKVLINDANNYGIKLFYSYENKEELINSNIVYNMFENFNIDDDGISLYNIKSIFQKYLNLNNITISFISDKKVYDNNADEVKNNKYYWYINKDNYKDKNIRISFKKGEILSQKNIVISDNNFKVGIYLFLIILLLSFLVIFEKIRKSNK